MTEKDLEREIRNLRGDLSKLAEMLLDAGILEMSSEILIFAPRNIPIGELCVGSDIPNIKRQLGLLLAELGYEAVYEPAREAEVVLRKRKEGE